MCSCWLRDLRAAVELIGVREGFGGTSDLSGEFSRLPVRTRGELERGTGVLPEWG